MSLLPSSPDVSPDGEPRVVGLDSEEADDLMAALSSTTARQLLAELHEEPAPPGELADRADTSLQNAQYHLEKLEDAGAIEVVGTAYSEKGREMRVYGPADSPLVIFAGEKERASGLRAALSRLFGGFLALAVGALAVQELFGGVPESAAPTGSGGSDAGGNGGGVEATQTPTPETTPQGTTTATESNDVGAFDATETPAPEATESTTTAEPMDTPAATEQASTPAETATPTPTAEDAATPADGATEFLDPLFDALFGAGLEPGIAFFLGGATVLTVVVALTYLRGR
ncbi:helix-turn-helix domain-containing protein [Natronomonas sp. CBA1123]|uniref:ArsR/SmtB family transcription factor n=1 Tax=Natronomonas sp. CBA1123 TaxID=2668070 RepID=UPI0012EA28A4|nr:winged helix-turn-helix domain-containing protein [Natronomonas sp. CBA1123]MUV85488.1 helix-turn-helix domain-containing protein [Natronomonas sp. CBA1123]